MSKRYSETADIHITKKSRYSNPQDASPAISLSAGSYTVGWVCALPLEMAAAAAMLDESHSDQELERHPSDNNTYTLGEIGNHNIVIACLPLGVYGTTSATAVAGQMASTFTSIRSWLMVGIGGGVPSSKADIRLGDVVVSKGVIQYDYGKTVAEGRLERTGMLNKPPPLLLTAISKLQADHERAKTRIPDLLSEMLGKHPYMSVKYTHRGQQDDQLFQAEYSHANSEATCQNCNRSRLVVRDPRVDDCPVIHYGLVASGNQVMKDGVTREKLRCELDILCFEMEAAGLSDNFPCLAIRGICDYADSHKNKQWQEYSAATAAAYAKELLLSIPPTRVAKSIPASDQVQPGYSTKQRQILMDSLKFDQINSRQMTIKSAHAKTCKWLLDKAEYRDWLDSGQIFKHHGFLWIKGKPGVGKSTIMKFALNRAEKMMTDSLIISFFFNARGENLEKLTTGMYRTLIFQLLKRVPQLQDVFDSLDSLPPSGGDIENYWSIELLQDVFKQMLQRLGRERIVCFIDALDECDEDMVRDMVEFFEELAQLAISRGTQLYICFSSRHYPQITIEKGLELIIEGQEGHTQDIADYLQSELKAGNSKQAQEIRTEILEKASGIFLWVVLVIQILNKEYSRGRLHALRKRLREIPTRLNELFKEILTRDSQNMGELLLCIQWILYAKRPLNPAELYFAILSGESPEDLDAWNPEDLTKEDMERFILSSSKGLAELTKSKDQIVQFIHESVRDFLLKDNGIHELWSEFDELNSHERLKQCCYSYLKVDMSDHLPLDRTLPPASTPEATEIRQKASANFPFLEYAVRHVFYHADLAQLNGLSQDGFIDTFPLDIWIALDNVIARFQSRRHTPKASLLYIFAEQNLPNLIKIELKKTRTIHIRGERFYYPVFAALYNGNEKAIKALLELDFDPRTEVDIEQHRELAELLDIGTTLTSVPEKNMTFIAYAGERQKWAIVNLLLDTGMADFGDHIDIINRSYPTLLSYAASAGKTTVVRRVLELIDDVDPESQLDLALPLVSATVHGHGDIVDMLLENGADLNTHIGRSTYPYPAVDMELLPFAALRGYDTVVQTLIEYGAEIENISSARETPLYIAAKAGHEAVVDILLANGANMSATERGGQTPLICAAMGGHEAVIQLLLDNGVEVNAQDNNGNTAVLSAANNGHKAAAKLLLDNGAKVEAIPQEVRGLYRNAMMLLREIQKDLRVHEDGPSLGPYKVLAPSYCLDLDTRLGAK